MTERQCENCHRHPARRRCPCGCIIAVCESCHETMSAIQNRIDKMFRR